MLLTNFITPSLFILTIKNEQLINQLAIKAEELMRASRNREVTFRYRDIKICVIWVNVQTLNCLI